MARDFDRSLGGKADALIKVALEAITGRIGDQGIAALCESEIEGMLSIAFYANELMGNYLTTNKIVTGYYIGTEVQTIEEMVESCCEPNVIHVWPQVIVGEYRVDFMCYMETILPSSLWPNATPVRNFLAVECDGHDFHERTKKQAARDRARDRALLAAGIPSMRFTGSEIWGDAYGCVTEIDHFFLKKWQAIYDLECAAHLRSEEKK